MKVLLAIDDNVCSQSVIRAAAQEQWPEGTEIRLLTVIEDLNKLYGDTASPRSEEDTAEGDRRVEHAAALCQKALQRIKKNREGLEISYEVKTGTPAAAIVESAKNWQADKIMIGAHGRSVCPHNFVGSVSRSVKDQFGDRVEVVAGEPSSFLG
ncbi:MAG: universal stress protein [Cyanobacteria bacterium SZAS TMP-1]|nr:universal stress protein [Cyanobacteria bacterium SZAS TMP-1]